MHLQEVQGKSVRLFERYLEAAPQVVLQLYIVINHTYHPDSDIGGGWVIRVSCLFSLGSLALSLTTYMIMSKNIMNTFVDQFGEIQALGYVHAEMPLSAKSLHLVTSFCFVCCRVWTLAIFAYTFPRTMFMACGVHWVCAWMWTTYKTSGTIGFWRSIRFSVNFMEKICCGFISIFVPVLLDETRKGKREEYASFYSIYFVQNLAMIVVTFIYLSAPPVILWATVISSVLFMFGIVLMLVYYRWFHPTVKDKFETTSQALKYLLTWRTSSCENRIDE